MKEYDGLILAFMNLRDDLKSLNLKKNNYNCYDGSVQ